MYIYIYIYIFFLYVYTYIPIKLRFLSICNLSEDFYERSTWRKKSWKGIRPYFGKCFFNSELIALFENNSIMANEKKIEATRSSFLKDITKSFNMRFIEKFGTKDLNIHQRITKIKEFFPDIDPNELNFEIASMEDVNKEILDPNIKNSSTSN